LKHGSGSLRCEIEIGKEKCAVCDKAKTNNKTAPVFLVELQNDHDAIRKEAELLQTATKQPKAESKSKLLRHCNRLQELFTNHYMKEEHVLFPLLSRYLDSSTSMTVGHEHKEISSLLRKVARQISRNEKNSVPRLNQLLRTHFSREENVLFWYLSLQHSDLKRT
jgi:iron-sulfur cluster repair protein YtfE (RIC family)